MSKRVIGYILVSTALVLTFLAFVPNYVPGRSLVTNLASTRILEVFTTTSEVKRCPTPPAPRTLELPPPTSQTMTYYPTLDSAPPGCASTRDDPRYSPTATYRDYTTVVHFAGVTLGTVTALTGVIALIGVGLLIFGGKGKEPPAS